MSNFKNLFLLYSLLGDLDMMKLLFNNKYINDAFLNKILLYKDKKDIEILDFLINKGADYKNKQALINSLKINNLDVIQYLINLGSDIHFNNDELIKLSFNYSNIYPIYLINQYDFKILDSYLFDNLNNFEIFKFLIENPKYKLNKEYLYEKIYENIFIDIPKINYDIKIIEYLITNKNFKFKDNINLNIEAKNIDIDFINTIELSFIKYNNYLKIIINKNNINNLNNIYKILLENNFNLLFEDLVICNLAIEKGYLNIIKTLILNKFPINDVDKNFCIQYNQYKILSYLIKNNIKITEENIIRSIKYNNFKIFKLLINKRKININELLLKGIDKNTNINFIKNTNIDKSLILIKACKEGNIKMVKLILGEDNINGFLEASDNNHLNIMKLINNNDNEIINYKEELSEALINACSNANLLMIKYLLKLGADINYENGLALLIAIEDNNKIKIDNKIYYRPFEDPNNQKIINLFNLNKDNKTIIKNFLIFQEQIKEQKIRLKIVKYLILNGIELEQDDLSLYINDNIPNIPLIKYLIKKVDLETDNKILLKLIPKFKFNKDLHEGIKKLNGYNY